ncbi:MAG: hypothetical protein LBJ45_02620, partial [Holosporaceae bacterium]|nr:hypothetical protein [Holosporaceae bacterium]
MYRIDIFGRKWYTAKEFDKHILSDEFEKEKVVGHPTNCIPYIDFGKWDRDTRAFNEFALPRVVDWVKEVSQKPRSTPLHWRDVDLAVAHELDEFLKAYPKKDYELGPNTYGFRKNVLLPKLMNGRSGIPVDSIPLDLIGILYIPNDSQWDKS